MSNYQTDDLKDALKLRDLLCKCGVDECAIFIPLEKGEQKNEQLGSVDHNVPEFINQRLQSIHDAQICKQIGEEEV